MTTTCHSTPASGGYHKGHSNLHVLLTTIIIFIGWGIVFCLGFLDWPGRAEKHDCAFNYLTDAACFCEKPRPNWIIKQPGNTISNLAYAAGALFCAWISDRQSFLPPSKEGGHFYRSSNSSKTDLMLVERKYFSISFCLVLANISHCSALYHGGWILYGQILDLLSLYAMFFWLMFYIIIKFVVMYLGWNDRKTNTAAAKVHALMMIITIATISIILFLRSEMPPSAQRLLYFIPPSVACAGDILMHCAVNRKKRVQSASREFSPNLRFLVLAIFCLGLGFIIQRTSNPGSWLCNSESFLQFHSLWHTLSALAAVFVYVHIRTGEHILIEHWFEEEESSGETQLDVETTDKSSCPGSYGYQWVSPKMLDIDRYVAVIEASLTSTQVADANSKESSVCTSCDSTDDPDIEIGKDYTSGHY